MNYKLTEEQISTINECIGKFVQFCKTVIEKVTEIINEFLDYIKQIKVNHYKQIKKGKRLILKISTEPLYKCLLKMRVKR